MYKIGDKVVCLVDYSVLLQVQILGIDYPKKDKMYKIRDIIPFRGIVFLLLEEIRNKIGTYHDGTYEPRFGMIDFRKVDESFADEILANINEQIEEEVLVRI